MLEKLERYEQQAYDGGFGADWLTEIGENLKWYVEHCIENKKRITMSGFMSWIDGLANSHKME